MFQDNFHDDLWIKIKPMKLCGFDREVWTWKYIDEFNLVTDNQMKTIMNGFKFILYT